MDYLLQVSYSIPVYRSKPPIEILKRIKEDLDSIIDQQILICDSSHSITFADTEEMDEYERIYTLSKLMQMRKNEVEAQQKAIAQIQNNKK